MAPSATAAASSGTGGASASASASNPSLMPGSLEEANARYQSTKTALREGLARKRQIDRTLTDLESQIYLYEGSYLSTTAASGGNIIKGFDSYLKNTSSQHAAAAAAAKGIPIEVPLEDRIFSLSSATYQKSLELKKAEETAAAAAADTAKDEKKDKDKEKDKDGKDGKDAKEGKEKTGKKDKDKEKDKEKDKKDDDTSGPNAGSKVEKEGKKSKKDRIGSEDREKRSGTPLAREKADGGASAISTPSGKAGKMPSSGLVSKLKRKAEGGAGTPSGKNSNKRKKEDE